MSDKNPICKKCGDELYTVSGLTDYDLRDGIRSAKYCDTCHILFGSHAHGLEKVASLASASRVRELEAEVVELEEEKNTLRSRHAALVEELKEEKQWSARLLETREQFSRELGQFHQARKLDYERHAALVELSSKLVGECEAEFTLDGYWNDDGALVTRKTVNKLKAALAEVK